MKTTILGLAFVAAFGFTATAAMADTLADVKAKGFIQCGVSPSTPGFALPDASNNWAGLDVEYCKAVAAAVFNNADAVRYSPLTSTEMKTPSMV